MSKKKSRRKPARNFQKIFTEFGSAISEVFNDPKLKKEAKELGRSMAVSAKILGKRFKDKEVQAKFKKAGHAAKSFGKDVADYFDEKKSKKK